MEWISLSAFAKVFCILGNSSDTQAGSLQICLSLNFLLHRASRSVRGESLGPSQVFSENAHIPAHVSGLLDSQEYAKVFQSPLWTAHALTFPLRLSLAPCLPQLLSLPQATVMLHDCYWLFSTNAPRKKGLLALSKLQARSNKHNLSREVI